MSQNLFVTNSGNANTHSEKSTVDVVCPEGDSTKNTDKDTNLQNL